MRLAACVERSEHAQRRRRRGTAAWRRAPGRPGRTRRRRATALGGDERQRRRSRPGRRTSSSRSPAAAGAAVRQPGRRAATSSTRPRARTARARARAASPSSNVHRASTPSAHGPRCALSSGTVAVSTGAIARPGATPNSTSTNTRMPSAAHSVPCASGRCWKCGSSLFGPQKICSRDAQHVDRRQERADHAREQPPR